MKKNYRRGGPVSKMVMAGLVLATTVGFVSGLTRNVSSSADGDSSVWSYVQRFFDGPYANPTVAAQSDQSAARKAQTVTRVYTPVAAEKSGDHPVLEPRQITLVEPVVANTAGVDANGVQTFDSSASSAQAAVSTSASSGRVYSTSATSAQDGETDWNNAGGTSWLAAASWTAVTGSAPPAAGDVAWFKTAFSSGQPSVNTPVSIAGLYFSSTLSSGYAIVRTTTNTFTLTGFATSIGTEVSDATAVAIGANNTSGTNSIAVPIALAPSSGSTSTFFQAAGGTLTLTSTTVISGTGKALNLTGGGTMSFAATSTYDGGTKIAGPTVINAQATNPFGTGTLELNSGTLKNSTASTTRTLSNVVSITGDFTFDAGGATGNNTFTGGGSTTGDRLLTINTSTTSFTTAAFTLGGNLTTAGTGAFTISGGLNLGAVDRTITGGATGQTTISGAVDSSAAGHKLVLGGTNVTMSAVTPGATNTVNFEINSTGPVLFTGAGTYVGTTTLTAGELSFGTSTVLAGGVISTGPVGKGTLHLGSGTNSAILSTNAGSGTTRTVQNSVTLDGDLTFAPGTGQTTGRIALDVATGLTSANTFTLTRTNQVTVSTGETVDLIGAITGSTFGITKLGAGTLNFGNGGATDANANTFNGLTTVSAGLVNLRKTAGTDAIAGDLLINGTGTVATAHNDEINNASSVTVNNTGVLSLGANTETIANLTVGSGSVTGTGGTLIIAGAGNTMVDSGSVSVSNLTTGTSGLTLGSGATVSSATTLNGNVTFNGATTGATFGAVTPPAITLNGNRNFTVATGTSGTDLTVSGTISDGTVVGSGITKLGSGTMLLSAANTYTGTTAVNSGTLLVNGGVVGTSSGTGTGPVNVSGGTLGGTGNISGTVSVSSGTINPGTVGTVGTLHIGALTMTGGTAAFDFATPSSFDQLISAGSVDLGNNVAALSVTIASNQNFTANTVYALITGSSLTGTFSGIVDGNTYSFSGYDFVADYTGTNFDLIAVPEPSTWIGGALALGAVAFMQRRKLRGYLLSVRGS